MLSSQVECTMQYEINGTPTADMTQKFLLSQKSMSIMCELSGPSLFGAAGVHCDFATPDVLLSLECCKSHDIETEYARHLVPQQYFKLICVQQTESDRDCCHIQELSVDR